MLTSRCTCVVWAAPIAVAVLFGTLHGCGEPSTNGHWQGTPVDGGLPDRFDLGSAYPTADPDPEGGTRAAPEFDGGAPPGPFSCTGKTGTAGDKVLTLTAGGLPRTSLLHVPPSYDPTRGTMLVVSFHGYSSDALQQAVLTRMNGSSDQHGFVVAYPNGVARSWNAGACCGTAWTDSVDDVGFAKALLARIGDDWCVDPKRIFATGFSNGGFFVHRLACEMSDTFAAIAPVSGVFGMDPTTCNPPRAVPVLHVHGTGDPIVPYNGGTPIVPIDLGPVLAFRSVVDSLQIWRTKNACLGGPTTIFAQGDATCTEWTSCKGGADVVHCRILDGGHTWPGGVPIPFVGKTSTDLSATETMFAFFTAHPMP